MTDIVNVALVGYGYAGKTIHAPLIQHCPLLRLHSIVSSRGEALAGLPGKPRICSDFGQVLADDEIDLVVIASPNDSHFPLAEAALHAGKHVVVDKPFTLRLREAQQLQVLAGQRHKLLSVFHNRRWDADFLTVRKLLQAGTLGEIALFESRFERFRPQVLSRWREDAAPGGGLWYDLAPHLLDQAYQLFGMPHAIHVDMAAQRQGAAAIDYFHAQLRYGRMRVRLAGSCLISGGSPRFAIHGHSGSYIKYGMDSQETSLRAGEMPGSHEWGLDPIPGLHYWQQDGEERGQAIPNERGDYGAFYQAIGEALLQGLSNPVPPHEAVAVQQLLELGLDSAHNGCELLIR